jgi:hypothetical protein
MYSSFENAYMPNLPLTSFSPYCAWWVFVAERNLPHVDVMSIQYQTAYKNAFKNEKILLYTQLPDDVLSSLLGEFFLDY